MGAISANGSAGYRTMSAEPENRASAGQRKRLRIRAIEGNSGSSLWAYAGASSRGSPCGVP